VWNASTTCKARRPRGVGRACPPMRFISRKTPRLSNLPRPHEHSIHSARFPCAIGLGGAQRLRCAARGRGESAHLSRRPGRPGRKVTLVTLHGRVDAYGTVASESAGGGTTAGAARLSALAVGVVMAVPVKEGERVEAGSAVVVRRRRRRHPIFINSPLV